MTGQAPAPLLNHRQMEVALLTSLRRLAVIADGFGQTEWRKRLESEEQRLLNHAFSIAVVGEFKRGKSTLINALLGADILPADIAPTSATINRVRYGLEPKAEIIFRDGASQLVALETLGEYVTKLTPESKAVAMSVSQAIVYYPSPFCRGNIDLIDTPGLSDDREMTAVTAGILPEVDAAIFVTLATSPFSDSEGKFLLELLDEYSLKTVLFVVTGIDRIRSEQDRQRVLNAVRERIREAVTRYAAAHFGGGSEAYDSFIRNTGTPRVFGVSGYDGLMGKVEADDPLLERSGLPAFELFLHRFLAEESGLVLLKAHAERLASYSDAVLQLLTSRTASAAQPRRKHRGVEVLLDSVETLLREEKSRLEMEKLEAVRGLHAKLPELPRLLSEAAREPLNRISASGDDLDASRFSNFVINSVNTVNHALTLQTQAFATQLWADLRSRLESSLLGLVTFCVVYDRVIAYFHAKMAGSETAQPEIARQWCAGCTGEFGSDTSASEQQKSLLARLIDPHQKRFEAALREGVKMPVTWTSQIPIRQPQQRSGFTKKIQDFVRAQQLTSELRDGLSTAIPRSIEQASPSRNQAIAEQVKQAFDLIATQFEVAQDDLQKYSRRLRAEIQTATDRTDRERRAREQSAAEIEAIRKHGLELVRQLDTVQFRVPPPAESRPLTSSP